MGIARQYQIQHTNQKPTTLMIKTLTSPNNPKETQPQCLKTLADTYLEA